MNFRQLGSTGLKVSEIGFGTWGIGGNPEGMKAYGPTADTQSRAALCLAARLGVNFFDTADLYGLGHSERLLGQVFADSTWPVHLASKVGFVGADGQQDFSPEHLRSSLARSLTRLRAARLDLYQLHSPPRSLLERPDPVRRVLEDLRRQGKIRAWGVSLRSPDDGALALDRLRPATVQINYSLVDQRARTNGLLDRCLAENVGVIVRSPLCFGFLSGGYAADMVFHADDHRARWSPEQRQRWITAVELFYRQGKDGRLGTPAQFALRFCLSHPAVSTAVPGMLDLEQVEENVAASELGPLPHEEIEHAVGVYANHQFYMSAP